LPRGAIASVLLPALAGLFLVRPALCQSKEPEPPEVRVRSGSYRPSTANLSVQSNLVELRVAFRDSAFHPASPLTQADFKIFDNGKPQQISFFSEVKAGTAAADGTLPQNASAPQAPSGRRSIVLFFDDTHGTIRPLQQAAKAAREFVNNSVQPGDQVAIFTDSGTVEQTFTPDRALLLTAIDRVSLHPQRGAYGITECPVLTPYEAYVIANSLDMKALNTAVAAAVACGICSSTVRRDCELRVTAYVQDMARNAWDGIRDQSGALLDNIRSAIRVLATMPGDRLFVLLSIGFASGEFEQETSAVLDAALRAQIVMNSLDTEGLLTRMELPELQRVDEIVRQHVLPEFMSTAAAATGGRFVMNANDLSETLRVMASAPAVSYFIGFAPTATADGKLHRLKVVVGGVPENRLQFRAAYFSASPKKSGLSVQDRIDRAVASNDSILPFPVAAHLAPGAPQDGQPTLVVTIDVDAPQFKFDRRGGRQVQELTFTTVLKTCSGDRIAGKQAIMDLSLKPETLASLKAKGIHATLTFPAPTGPYQVRTVVREAVQDRLAATSTRSNCH